MWPSDFEYQRASSIDEAVKLAGGKGARLLAGGHSLLPAMKLRLAEARTLVDIGRIKGLKGIKATGGNLEIGAGATHAEIAASKDVQKHCPALAQAVSTIGDPQVRNWGTLGGNIAHADPASDPPTVLVACGATIHVQGAKGTREIAAEKFFKGLFETALKRGEVITKVSIPSLKDKKSAYVKLFHPASRYALVGVCVVLDVNKGQCASARVAIGGAVPNATRSKGAEKALTGSSLDGAALDKASAALQADIKDDVMGDISAPEAYRAAMSGVYLKRAVKAATG